MPWGLLSWEVRWGEPQHLWTGAGCQQGLQRRPTHPGCQRAPLWTVWRERTGLRSPCQHYPLLLSTPAPFLGLSWDGFFFVQ